MIRPAILFLILVLALSACGESSNTAEITTQEIESTAGALATPSEGAQSAGPQVILGLEYRPEAFFENQLDLYLPASNGISTSPAVLLLHGGGGDKHNLEDLANQFVDQGYAAVAANFRSMGGGEYPGTVEDAFCALAWMIHAAEEYGLDTSQYYVVGFSQGGTLAAMLGVVDEPELYLASCPNDLPDGFRLRGVVVFTGIFDYASAAHTNQAMQHYVEGYLGAAIDESPEVWVQASAMNWVDGSEPPFLLLHGEVDENINPQQTHLFAARLEDVGVEVEKVIIPGVEHFGLIADENALQAMFEFIQD